MMQELHLTIVKSCVVDHWRPILTSCVIACFLNVIIALTIATMSGIGFLLVGIVKDIAIVCVSTTIMGEHISYKQFLGFLGAILGVMGYGIFQMNSQYFEDDNIVAGFSRFISGQFHGRKVINDTSCTPSV